MSEIKITIHGREFKARLNNSAAAQALCYQMPMTVVMDELNDLEMGKLLSACDLTVGTRLHSAIISMNFGTPAIAINYEHKSAGIMQQLGMPEMAVDIRHLLDGSLGAMVGDTLGQLPAINERLAVAVKAEREKGIGMVKSVLDRVREGK